jgi:hypothetical protein
MPSEQESQTHLQMSDKLTLDKPPEEPPEELVLRLPESARLPEGTTFYEGPDDGYCRAILPARGRCQGIRTKAYGLCQGHAGTSKLLSDPAAHGRKGAGAKARIRERHALLAKNGINPRRAAQAVAIRRSDAVVRALVDAPLDDEKLGTIERQRAIIGMLDAVFPLATVSAEIELPGSADAVESLQWSDMQRLAAQLLPEIEAGPQAE